MVMGAMLGEIIHPYSKQVLLMSPDKQLYRWLLGGLPRVRDPQIAVVGLVVRFCCCFRDYFPVIFLHEPRRYGVSGEIHTSIGQSAAVGVMGQNEGITIDGVQAPCTRLSIAPQILTVPFAM